jgi:hypothetical protein
MALSSRYAMLSALVLVVAGILNLVISQDLSTRETCANPNGLPRITALPGFEPRGRVRGKLTDTVIEWSEGRLPGSRTEPPMDLWLIRSIRPPELYERPVRFLERKMSPETHRVIEVETSDGPLPVHLLEDYTSNPGTVVGYLLIHGNEPIENAFSTHVRNLARSVIQGATPLTLVIVSRQAVRRGSAQAQTNVSQVLASVWENFDAACRP